uniref:ubiquinone biosynthesis protein COQ4 homolog, mitochondrial-like n=1 Tax=Styela clava TaxID=7725 RepID=UPI001939FB0B|nr:ubiquinone biosynthesis protein COQ4 homolog, mitochondrial-like [Styela clava]
MSLYTGHITTSYIQKSLLAVGSAVASLSNPYRHDMVAVCGEVTGTNALQYMLSRMQKDPVGREILETRPRINSTTVDMNHLRTLKDDTFGKQYVEFLDRFKITPDSRRPVKFVDDENLAYVMQRYREVHDFNHLLLNQPTNILGEIVVKWFEALQTRLPMCYLAALAGPVRLSQKQKKLLVQKRLPWIAETASSAKFFMNIYFENKFEDKIHDVREEMNIILYKKSSDRK